MNQDVAAAIEELRKRRPDLIFLQAARTDGKLQNLGWENLTDENIRQLSYDYLGGMVVAHGYAYLTYAPADRSARLGAVMRAAGLID